MFKSVKDFVIIKPIYQSTIGNLIIPEASRFGKNSGHGEFQLYHGFIYGIVEAVGRDYKAQTFNGEPLLAGDKVIWERHEGKRFYYQDQEYLRLRGNSVLAKINL